jgi:hypothetical protein
VLLLNVIPLFSSVPKLHFQISNKKLRIHNITAKAALELQLKWINVVPRNCKTPRKCFVNSN